MKRSDKIFAVVMGLIFAAILCNLAGTALTREVGTVAFSAASIAQSQAMGEQAKALSNMADTVQTQARTNTLNLLIVIAGIIVVLYLGVRVGMQISHHPTSPTPLPELKPIPPAPQIIVLDKPVLPALEEAETIDAATVLALLFDSEAWK